MLWESIVKSPRDRKVIPNLPDYGQARTSFFWGESRRSLDGLAEGAVRLPHVAAAKPLVL